MPDLSPSRDDTVTGDELPDVPLMQHLSDVYATSALAAAVDLDVFSKISGCGATSEEAEELFD